MRESSALRDKRRSRRRMYHQAFARWSTSITKPSSPRCAAKSLYPAAVLAYLKWSCGPPPRSVQAPPPVACCS